MSSFWNRDIKRIILVMALTFIVGGVFTNLAIFRYQKHVSAAQYNAYAGALSVIKEAYPEAEEDEIIRNLTKASDAASGESILRQYGILKDGELYRGQNKGKTEVILAANLIFLATAAVSLLALILFWKVRSRKLRELGSYVDRVSHGHYELELQKNLEDELSGLRNELYKLTVLYKEQADSAQAGKAALADSVANISHQLKTPLTSAVILTDNLLESPDMDLQTRTKFLQEISRQLVGMKWLVISMLKLSRLDAGVVELQKEQVNLKKIAEDAMTNLEMMAQWKEIRFETNLEDVTVSGDGKWLSEALQNIVKNAIEHSPQGGVIEIETQENEVYCQVSVKDHGEGISEVDQKHLFERFYKASKVENENVGIGLALAKEVVERQNGSITVDSGENGTCFYVRILKYQG
ncbi:MAG: HAMP domain-containing histidine kinase [Lachnospiraceae bacterium]|nr:HAMP domain-containing histidine kinase [Lachnospiraceae bacterium]MBO7338797.1 HAMP domain-containing histidine kinase [Lachnospiraceae bacterium]